MKRYILILSFLSIYACVFTQELQKSVTQCHFSKQDDIPNLIFRNKVQQIENSATLEDYNLRLDNYWGDYFYYGETEAYPNFTLPYIEEGYYNEYKTWGYHGIPYQNPYWSFQNIAAFRGRFTNIGKYSVSGITIESNIYKYNGENEEKIFNVKSEPISTLEVGEWTWQEKILNPFFQIPQQESSIGAYRFTGYVSCAEGDNDESDNHYEYKFTINDNLFGYANPKYTVPYHPDNTGEFRSGPCSFVGAQSGDGGGVIFRTMPNENGLPHTLEGINFWVPDNIFHRNVWRDNYKFTVHGQIFLETLHTGERYFDKVNNWSQIPPVIETLSFEIDSSLVNSWVFLPFNKDGVKEKIIPAQGGEDILVLVRVEWPNGNINRWRWYFSADGYSHTSMGGAWFTHCDMDYPRAQPFVNNNMQLLCNPNHLATELPTGNLKLNVYYGDKGSNTWANGATVTFKYNIILGTEIEQINDVKTVNNGSLEFTNHRYSNYGYWVNFKYNENNDSIFITYSVAIDRPNVEQTIWINKESNGAIIVDVMYDYDPPVISTGDIPVKTTLELYPNPVIDEITVLSENINKIVITNILGQVETIITNPEYGKPISVKHLTTGIYMLTVLNSAGESITERFMKK